MQNRLMMQSQEVDSVVSCFFPFSSSSSFAHSIRDESVCEKSALNMTNKHTYERICWFIYVAAAAAIKHFFIRHHRLYLEKWEHTTVLKPERKQQQQPQQNKHKKADRTL